MEYEEQASALSEGPASFSVVHMALDE